MKTARHSPSRLLLPILLVHCCTLLYIASVVIGKSTHICIISMLEPLGKTSPTTKLAKTSLSRKD